MKVPNNDRASIPIEKIRDYLLSNSHPIGKSKAVFFNKIGYNLEKIDLLSKELNRIILENEVYKEISTRYGNKYLVKGNIGLAFKKTIPVVTIWIIEKEDSVPRFVTAYPSDKEE